jgi:cytochrome b561
LPADIPAWQQRAALASHWLLYLLMFAMPLIGWAMVSASGTPITLIGTWTVPAIAPENADVFAVLRAAHRYLAYLLFATVLLHLAAGLFHGLIRRDGVLKSMVSNRA